MRGRPGPSAQGRGPGRTCGLGPVAPDVSARCAPGAKLGDPCNRTPHAPHVTRPPVDRCAPRSLPCAPGGCPLRLSIPAPNVNPCASGLPRRAHWAGAPLAPPTGVRNVTRRCQMAGVVIPCTPPSSARKGHTPASRYHAPRLPSASPMCPTERRKACAREPPPARACAKWGGSPCLPWHFYRCACLGQQPSRAWRLARHACLGQPPSKGTKAAQ